MSRLIGIIIVIGAAIFGITSAARAQDSSFFGLQIQEMTPAMNAALGLQKKDGVIIRDIAFPGPASHSQIQRGDIIVEIDHKPVRTVRDVTEMVSRFTPEMTIAMKVWRQGEHVDLTVTLGKLPPRWNIARSSFSTIPALGVTFTSLTEKVQDRFDLAWNARGVVVSLVDVKKSAGLDLKAGDVVVQVNQSDVWKPTHIVSSFKQAQKEKKEMVVLLVNRNGGYRFVLLPVPIIEKPQ